MIFAIRFADADAYFSRLRRFFLPLFALRYAMPLYLMPAAMCRCSADFDTLMPFRFHAFRRCRCHFRHDIAIDAFFAAFIAAFLICFSMPLSP